MAPVLFTVIIPTRNRLSSLMAVLDALKRQTIAPETFALSIAVDGATDGTQGWLMEQHIPFVETQGEGPAVARNQAARIAEGTFLAFLDDDVLPEPDWLLQAERALKAHPEAEVLEGDVVALGKKGPLAHWVEHRGKGGGLTCNLIVKRSRFWALDGFQESFAYPMNEDHELVLRLRRFTPIRHVPGMVVVHPVVQKSFAAEWNGAAEWVTARTESDEVLYKLHPQEYRTVKAHTTFYGTLKRQACCYGFDALRKSSGLWVNPVRTVLWMAVLLKRQYYFVRRFLARNGR